MNPRAALRVVPTHVKTAAITGAEHGAATSPDAAPMRSAPTAPPLRPAFEARAIRADGIGTGRTSNMTSANRISRFAMPKYAQGFELTDPKSVPVRPAIKPNVAYTRARPNT